MLRYDMLLNESSWETWHHPTDDDVIVGMAPLSECRLLIGRDCHVTRRTYSDGAGGLCQSRPGLRGERMGLAHARDDDEIETKPPEAVV